MGLALARLAVGDNCVALMTVCVVLLVHTWEGVWCSEVRY